MKLTDAEIEYTRRVAAEEGLDPEALIADGEQIKEAGYRRAYEDPSRSSVAGAAIR